MQRPCKAFYLASITKITGEIFNVGSETLKQ